jgi:outer membrane usher protein
LTETACAPCPRVRRATCGMPRGRAAARIALAAMGGIAAGVLAQTGPAAPAAVPAADKLRPVDVRVNQVKHGAWTLLERSGVLYAPEDAFEEWRLTRSPGSAPVQSRGQLWYSLADVPGFTVRFNEPDQSLDLEFASGAFAASRLADPAIERERVSPVEPTVFLNYDLNAEHGAARGAASQQSLGMLGEFGLATEAGLLTSSFVGRHIAARGIAAAEPRWQRLETTFTRDFLDRNVTLRLGDVSSRTGVMGRPVYFGGLQWSRNFALQPGFISQPVPPIAGTSSAPSTVDLYVNSVLRQTSNVPTGPFTVDTLQMTSGAGQIRMVVRDVLGRESVIEQPFFVHPAMLEAGLADWSAEAGALRRNLGSGEASYEQRFASGFYRQGLSKTLTAEVRAGLSRPQQVGSAAFSQALSPWPVLLQAGLGASRSPVLGRGAVWLAGLDYLAPAGSLQWRTERTTNAYRDLGQDPSVPAPRQQSTLSGHVGSAAWGSFGASAARTVGSDGRTLNAGNLGYSRRIGTWSWLSFNLTRLTGASQGRSATMNLMVPLGSGLSAAAYVSRQARDTDGHVGISGGPDSASLLSWRLLAGERSEQSYLEGSLYRPGPHGTLSLSASASGTQQNLRAGAQGAIVLVDGDAFATRRNSGSLALVEVPGYGGLSVAVSGQYEASTRASGRALLTLLTPYRVNPIRLNASELPLDAELDSIELQAVPPPRAAVKLRFPVRSGRAALVRVRLDDGQDVPPGAEVRVVGDAAVFYVARRGEVFVTGLQPGAVAELRWKDQSCRLALELPPPKADDITRVGPLTCAGVRR